MAGETKGAGGSTHQKAPGPSAGGELELIMRDQAQVTHCAFITHF